MSDPPKPKPGSLRDRIAAFEKKPDAPSSGTPLAPRPKPGGLSWKPRPRSPPVSAGSGSVASADSIGEKRAVGGMSASDAKESIGQGGSLKERMAALQGKGAFGQPALPPLPKPSGDKPKWKPPPKPISPPEAEKEKEGSTQTYEPREYTESLPVKASEDDATPKEGSGGAGRSEVGEEHSDEPDAEEEERQRRAAIAARMARLGGARVGMAPPVFGKKPSYKKPDTLREEAEQKTEVAVEESKPVEHASHETLTQSPDLEATSPSPKADEESPGDYFPPRKSSASSSLLSVDSLRPAHSPSSMPLPTAPRRAAPPRKKPASAKSPPPILGEELKATPEGTLLADEGAQDKDILKKSERKAEDGDGENEIGGVSNDEVGDSDLHVEPPAEALEDEEPVVDELLMETEEPDPETNANAEAKPRSLSTSTSVAEMDKRHEEEDVESHDFAEDEETKDRIDNSAFSLEPIVPMASLAGDIPAEEASLEQTPPKIEEEGVDDATRRKRVAERLAKMGAFNPFSAPPPSPPESSTSPEPEQLVSTQDKPATTQPPVPPNPVPQERASLRKYSTDSSAFVVPPERRGSLRKVSVDDESIAAQPPVSPPPVPHKRASFRKDSTDAIITPERQGSVDSAISPPPPLPTSRAAISPPTSPKPDIPIRKGSIPSTGSDSNSSSAPVAREEVEGDEESKYGLKESQTHSVPEPVVEEEEEGVDKEYESCGDAEAETTSETRHLHDRDQEAYDVDDRMEFGGQIVTAVDQILFGRESDEQQQADRHEQHQDSEEMPPPPSMTPASPHLPLKSTRPEYIPERVPSTRRATPTRPLPSSSGEGHSENQSEMVASSRPSRRSTIPPPPPLQNETVAEKHGVPAEEQVSSPLSPHQSHPSRGRTLPPPVLSINDGQGEVLEEEEGDPIDPTFHSPSRRASVSPPSSHLPNPEAEPAPIPKDEPEEDPEQSRRRTIAERMAKLSGIKFGAPMAMGRPPPTPAVPREEDNNTETTVPEDPEPELTLTEAEEEQARKQRIANKLAGMGGMRIGMLPPGAGGGSQAARARREASDHSAEPASPVSPPPHTPIRATSTRVVPPSRPPPHPQSHEIDSEYESLANSEDGVKVEAEESEAEDVTFEVIGEQELPPPIPSRSSGPAYGSAPPTAEPTAPPSQKASQPAGRPPVPSGIPMRRPSVQASSSGRRSSFDTNVPGDQQRASQSSSSRQNSGKYQGPSAPVRPLPPPQSEYVMVEDPETLNSEEPMTIPPVKSARGGPPSRNAPTLPTVTQSFDPSDSVTSQWELPSIPSSSLDFSGNTPDLSLSTWSEDSTSYPQVAEAPPTSTNRKPTVTGHTAEAQLTPDELMAVWGKVGVQICEVATTLYEKSKKSLIGDGSYAGFVCTAITQVPNAASPTGDSYGHLIYLQNGMAVQRRTSEILPGDVVVFEDAKLKGHKGLQSYHQSIGSPESLVGVVSEFEVKRSKIKVFQANQHVGQQTVESASYRLEDLKSGTVKVFRVLEA